MFINLKLKLCTRLTVNRPPNISIHDLNDDSLVSIFHLCRPSVYIHDIAPWGNWVHERWWYKLVKVCRRWRQLILGLASHLGLCLVCTRGTPVAVMLAHSPPLPLIVFHSDQHHNLTMEEEEGITFTLRCCDRIQRIYLEMPAPSLQKIIPAIDGQFPMLQYLSIMPPTIHIAGLALPSTFEAPQLRLLNLKHFTSPIGSSLLSTAFGLVVLTLKCINPSTFLHPNHLFEALSLLPELEKLVICFFSPAPRRDVEMQLLHSPIVTHITLPKLYVFEFWGVSSYLEALLPNMTTPLLKVLIISFFHQLRFSVPHLRQFVITKEKIRFSSARFLFYHEAVAVFMYPLAGNSHHTFFIDVVCEHLDWQVSSLAQIFNFLEPAFSAIADLTLDYTVHSLSSGRHHHAGRRLWRELLGTFKNVRTLCVHKGLVGDLSDSLCSEGDSLQLLPELKELICPSQNVDDDTFTPFIRERHVAGRPVNLIGKAFPVSLTNYTFDSSYGPIYIQSDS